MSTELVHTILNVEDRQLGYITAIRELNLRKSNRVTEL
jgi:hypothetical protein